MASNYRNPGTYTTQELETSVPAGGATTKLPSVLIAPAYHVVEKSSASSTFDPRGSDQDFNWPDKKTGTVVDLAGTRNGRIDSQRKKYLTDGERRLESLVPKVWLKDGTNTIRVDDSNIYSIDQSGFTIDITARDGNKRADLNVYFVTVNQSTFLYNPDGGLDVVKDGDVFTYNSNDYTVDSFTGKRLFTSEDASQDAQTFDKYDTADDSTNYVTISPASTAGRIDISLNNITFGGSVGPGSAVVTGQMMSGLTTISGDYDSTNNFNNVNYGVSISTSDVEDYVVRVKNTNTGDVSIGQVVSVDTSNGTLTTTGIADSEIGSPSSTDPVEITIFDSQLGYVESINSSDDTVTAVVPEQISQNETWAWMLNSKNTITVYPDFEVLASYRASRKDLANQILKVTSDADIEDELDQSGVDYRDGLGWAAQTHWDAREQNAPFFMVPVDPEPDSSTGLPQNEDINSGYSDAINAAKDIKRGYNIWTLHQNTSIHDKIESHVSSMSSSSQQQERRGFEILEVPKGEWDQESGHIRPGKASGGVVSSIGSSEGNKNIRDPNLDFVTTANVVGGTVVKVTFPNLFEGRYKAKDTSTDNTLILEGDDWPIVREFRPGDGNSSSPHGMDIDDTNGDGTWEFRKVGTFTGNSGPTIPQDFFTHVEPGDYVEVKADFGNGSKVYRMKITNVLSNGKGFDADDEVPGGLSLGSEITGTEVSIIRSWSVDHLPSANYHIRPLDPEGQKNALINKKSQLDRRITVGLGQRPTQQIGTDAVGSPIDKKTPPAVSMAAAIAKRSSMEPYEDVSFKYLGGGIKEVEFGFGHFDLGQIEDLAGNGVLVFRQENRDSEPFIHDMQTSEHDKGLAYSEEVVTANADWQAKQLRKSFGPSPGDTPPQITEQLLGIRTAQINNLLGVWVEEDRLISFTLQKVEKASARRTDVVYDAVFPVGEKEVDVTMRVEV